MITPENAKEVFEMITKDQAQRIISSDGDYIKMNVSCSNHCTWVHVARKNYNETDEKETLDDGGIYCDLDGFLQLLDETNAKSVEITRLLEEL